MDDDGDDDSLDLTTLNSNFKCILVSESKGIERPPGETKGIYTERSNLGETPQ